MAVPFTTSLGFLGLLHFCGHLFSMNPGDLPYPSSAIDEKRRSHSGAIPWTRPVFVSIPGVHTRRLRILIPNVAFLNSFRASRTARKRGPFLVGVACMAVVCTFILVSKGLGSSDWGEPWQNGNPAEAPTLVFRREDLQRIWKWEIASGHYPSHEPSRLVFFMSFRVII